jgi:serine/threonine protein kinase
MNTTTKRAKSIFIAMIRNVAPEQWSGYLDVACCDDDELRQDVESLLKAHSGSDSFLAQLAAAVVATIDSPVVTEGVGAVIGPYKLREQIGEGGMGIVYMADQKEPVRRTVALKIIKPGMDTREVVARFEAERQALALMNHPNVSKVLDAGATASGRPYFVMELVRGIPITEFCDKQKLDSRQRLELFATVCQAVQHAHHRGIIHRDLKPSNVLVELHDVTAIPKVIDFGVAKATTQQLTELSLHTGFSQMIGTPMYMSPEQAELSGLDIDTRTDVYSLGVLLYELLSGTTPFTHETLKQASYDEMRRMIREDEPPRPSDRISTLAVASLSTISENRRIDPRKLSQMIRGELDWIVMKALEKDRTRRYESASAFAADVRHYLDDEPVVACPPSAVYRFRKFARRHKVPFFIAVLVSLALIAGATGLIVSNRLIAQGRNAAQLAEEQEKSQRQEAERQKKVAEQNLQFARKVVDDMYVGIATEWLAKETAASNIQTSFLKRGRNFYQRLADEPPQNSTELKSAAEVYERLGDINNYLREYRPAVEALKKSIDACEKLLAEKPDSRDDRLAMFSRCGRLGEWLKDLGDLKAADAAHEKSRDHLRELSNRFPDPTGYREMWGQHHLSRANLLAKMDDLGPAEENANKAREIFEALLEEKRAASKRKTSLDFQTSILLINSRGCQAEILQRQGRSSEAQTHYEKALRLCGSLRRWDFHDSRRLIVTEGHLEQGLAELHQLEGRLADAEQHLRQALDLKRRSLKSGLDPVLFIASATQGKANFDEGFQEVEFCGYLELQLRLALILHGTGRPYETEKMLGECRLTSLILADTDPNNVRYRVARANCWAQIGQLLAERRPEESAKFWQYAAVIWRDTLAKLPRCAEYRSGLHGRACDWAWFQENYPPRTPTDDSLQYVQFKEPFGDTAFSKHTAGLNWYRIGRWDVAIDYFTKAAEARTCDHAFDWFYLAMSHQQLGKSEEARRWYDKASESIQQTNNTDPELLRLAEQAKEVLKEDTLKHRGTENTE